MHIGINIYTLRKEKKITQAQLAEKLGVSEQAVSKWENNQCAPDVSLFPIIAEFFGVSIDRLFGYHTRSYNDDVQAIMKAADDSMDTYKEIEIISEGLKKYPNSPDLKVYLAFSLSMVNRMSKNENEKEEAVEKAIQLCTEVIDTCGNLKQLDKALNMLTRIYNETGNYKKAEEALAKGPVVCNAPTSKEFPYVGNPNVIYKAESEKLLYQWNSEEMKYEVLCQVGGGLDEEIQCIDGGTATG